jgi:hypothetical protein
MRNAFVTLSTPMAVTTLARPARAPLTVVSLAPGVCVAPLLAPALDLLRAVQPSVGLAMPALVAAVAAGVVLVITWARYPRTSWLAAATLAALASVALRLAGTEVAPALSLAAIVALGIGGAFASPTGELEAWLELSPAAPDGSGGGDPPPSIDRQLPPRAA